MLTLELVTARASRPSWLGTSNPGGDWLENTKKLCAEQFSSYKGCRKGPTGYTTKIIALKASDLINVPGRNGEERFRLTSSKFKALDAIVDGTPKNFKAKAHPILLGINYLGHPFIFEGNHRVAVAYMNGIGTVWAEVQWYGGSEELDGPWSPESLNKIHQSLIGV